MAKILEEEEEDDREGQAPAHTYSSSSYSLGGQTAMTRSIQSCGGKLCDLGMLSGRGVSAPATPFPCLGTMAQDQPAGVFFPWEGGPRWGWRSFWWGGLSQCNPSVWGSFQSLRFQNHRDQSCQVLE